ncbi:MAG: CBS domain-containing protein [Spirochaetes bacterium]|nr:CBS domain-containing protein [Spirochaetota bacterium]
MFTKTAFYFSDILGVKVLEEGFGVVGRIRDFYADVSSPRPRIVAAVVRRGKQERTIDFAPCRMSGVGRKRVIVVPEARDLTAPAENHLSLARNLLDRQIVDVDGRKLVRVNDLVLDSAALGAFLVAVDVGIEGLLRRLGVACFFNAAFRLFGKRLPPRLILWSEVEAVDFPSSHIKLSTAYSKLGTFHPSELADILEDLDRHSQVALFSALDEERAADVLEELKPVAQVGLLENLSEEKAADVLERMPADEVADILDELKREKAERLLDEMETKSSAEVRNLMLYPDNVVGSLMSTDYIFFNQSMTVGDALLELRKLKPEAETIYYVYVLDARGRYVATVSLRDIVVSEFDTRLGEIMNSGVPPFKDRDDLFSIADLVLKYKLHAVPVVNDDARMVGTIVIEDVLEHVMGKR